MKRTIFTLLIALTVCVANGQEISKNKQSDFRRGFFNTHLMKGAYANPSAKVTKTQRLKAITNLDGTKWKLDSVVGTHSRDLYFYNNNGQEVMSISIYDEGNGAIYIDSTFNKFNDQGKIIGYYNSSDSVKFMFNEKGQLISENNITTYKYDSIGNLIERTDGMAFKIQYEYNSDGKLISDTQFEWDYFNTNTWKLYSTTKYTYDLNGNISQEDYVFVSTAADKREYHYDFDVPVENLIIPFQAYFFFKTHKTVTQAIDSELKNSVWEEVDNFRFYYSPFIVDGIPLVNQLSIALVQNPVKDQLQIRGIESVGKVTLYDLSGKQVLSASVAANNPINVSRLASGVYIVKIATPRGVVERKMVKR